MNSSNTPQAFVSRWRGSGLTERASAQSHFIDLCRLLDVAAPTDEDRTGDSYSFEKGAQMRGGGQGWADVWKRGHFAWEYKGPGRDLERAYDQLLRYREALENPPLLVVSDIETIQLHTNFTNSRKVVHTWMLDDLLDPAQLERLRWLWTKPEKFRSRQTTEAITEEAARNFATLADLLRQAGHNPERAARFLIRLLFCLFAEDVRLLPEGLFTRLLSATRNDPAAFTAQLRQLFGTMSRGGYFGVDRIPTINGGLFDDDDVLPLPHEALGLLQAVARLDWAAIEPAIFGTLFERSLDPLRRGHIFTRGCHDR